MGIYGVGNFRSPLCPYSLRSYEVCPRFSLSQEKNTDPLNPTTTVQVWTHPPCQVKVLAQEASTPKT